MTSADEKQKITDTLRRGFKSKIPVLIERAVSAKQSGNLEQKADAEMRVSFLKALELRLQAESLFDSRPRLFISYSKASGSQYYDRAADRAAALGFTVLNGFNDKKARNVLRAVLDAISQCSVFMAILTPELRIDEPHGASNGPSFAPSVWVVEEKGMALALAKPFRMLVHECVHDDFWRRTTPGDLHHKFNDETFPACLEDTLQALIMRHEAKQLASVGVLSPEQY